MERFWSPEFELAIGGHLWDGDPKLWDVGTPITTVRVVHAIAGSLGFQRSEWHSVDEDDLLTGIALALAHELNEMLRDGLPTDPHRWAVGWVDEVLGEFQSPLVELVSAAKELGLAEHVVGPAAIASLAGAVRKVMSVELAERVSLLVTHWRVKDAVGHAETRRRESVRARRRDREGPLYVPPGRS